MDVKKLSAGDKIGIALLALLVLFRLAVMLAERIVQAPGPLPVSAALVIPEGDSIAVMEVLRRDGVIDHPGVFLAAAYFTRGQGPLHAAELFFPAYASIADILGILRYGVPVQHHVTIPEGLTGTEIAKILNAAPAASGSVPAPAEGSVLPQTYDFTLGTKREAILQRAQKAMQTGLDAAWAQRAPAVPLQSEQQALVLASIVQQETPLPAELPQIAAVYENRLAIGMKLQADPTVIYAASNGATSGGQPISRADLANPSAYNTYAHPGLPPGPICAPGLAAIQAVLHPAPIKAIYFVATGTGGHVFADNFTAQLRNIAAYRDAKK